MFSAKGDLIVAFSKSAIGSKSPMVCASNPPTITPLLAEIEQVLLRFMLDNLRPCRPVAQTISASPSSVAS
jgi:hypothetical protein